MFLRICLLVVILRVIFLICLPGSDGGRTGRRSLVDALPESADISTTWPTILLEVQEVIFVLEVIGIFPWTRDNLRRRIYSTVVYSTVVYSTVVYSTVVYSTVVYSTVAYSTVMYSTVVYSTVVYIKWSKWLLLLITIL